MTFLDSTPFRIYYGKDAENPLSEHSEKISTK